MEPISERHRVEVAGPSVFSSRVGVFEESARGAHELVSAGVRAWWLVRPTSFDSSQRGLRACNIWARMCAEVSLCVPTLPPALRGVAVHNFVHRLGLLADRQAHFPCLSCARTGCRNPSVSASTLGEGMSELEHTQDGWIRPVCLGFSRVASA